MIRKGSKSYLAGALPSLDQSINLGESALDRLTS